MLGALSQKHGQFRCGQYLNKGKDFHNAPFFQYEVIQGERAIYAQIIQNLITSESSTIIKTNYALDWVVHGRVQLQNKKLYLITNFEKIEEELNPQSFGLMVEGSDVSYYIELVEVKDAYHGVVME